MKHNLYKIVRKNAETEIKNCFERSEITKNDLKLQQHFMDIGWYQFKH